MRYEDEDGDGVRGRGSEFRHSLPQSLTVCTAIVKACFPSSYQKISFEWKAMRATIVAHCEMLPSHPTLWLCGMLSITALTFYTFSTRWRQL